MLESCHILESNFTEENKNLLEILETISTLAITSFNNTDQKEKDNSAKKITDICTSVIKDFRNILREDLESKLNESKTILNNLPNTKKEIENISSVITYNHNHLSMRNQ